MLAIFQHKQRNMVLLQATESSEHADQKHSAKIAYLRKNQGFPNTCRVVQNRPKRSNLGDHKKNVGKPVLPETPVSAMMMSNPVSRMNAAVRCPKIPQ